MSVFVEITVSVVEINGDGVPVLERHGPFDGVGHAIAWLASVTPTGVALDARIIDHTPPNQGGSA